MVDGKSFKGITLGIIKEAFVCCVYSWCCTEFVRNAQTDNVNNASFPGKEKKNTRKSLNH
jgi:hypothetical protein